MGKWRRHAMTVEAEVLNRKAMEAREARIAEESRLALEAREAKVAEESRLALEAREAKVAEESRLMRQQVPVPPIMGTKSEIVAWLVDYTNHPTADRRRLLRETRAHLISRVTSARVTSTLANII